MTIIPKITSSTYTNTNNSINNTKMREINVVLDVICTNKYSIRHSGGLDGIQSVHLLVNNTTEELDIGRKYTFNVSASDSCQLLVTTPNGLAKYKL